MPRSATAAVGEKKETATTFLQLVSTGSVQRAFDSFTTPDFIHHNPWFTSDAQSLARGMQENAAQFPEKMLHVEHAVEEGDLVAVHSRVRHKPEDPDIAVVHIFRFEGDRIAELWDVAQEPVKNSPNKLGMF